MSYLSTLSGNKIELINVHSNDYHIEDIAAGLSRQWRWNGHTDKFYSVAQHSVIVSRNVAKEHALAGLMHDASEAFIGDMPRPAKKLCKDYYVLENRLMEDIAEYFNFPYPLPEDVHIADNRTLVTEARDLRKNSFFDVENFQGIQPYDFTIDPLPVEEANALFIDRFREILET